MISVISSVYNSEKYLDLYLDMINSQFSESFEVVFVDANSQDRSLEVISNFKFKEKIKVKIIPQNKNLTIYEAWNVAIKNSTGKYILNWNTDDSLFPSAIKTYEDYARKYSDIDLFYGPCFTSKNQGFESPSNILIWPNYSHEVLLTRCICGPFPLVKKSAIEKVGYFSEKYVSSGDYDMWLKLSKGNFKFKKIPEIVGCFLDRPDSISKEKIHLAQKEDREIQNKYSH